LNFRKGNYIKAGELFEKSLYYGGRQQDVRIDYYLGMCYFMQGNLDKAYSHLNMAIALFPDFSDASYGMGKVLRAKKEYQQALVYFDKAMTLFPSIGLYYVDSIQIYLESAGMMRPWHCWTKRRSEFRKQILSY